MYRILFYLIAIIFSVTVYAERSQIVFPFEVEGDRPEYPDEFRRDGIEGKVEIEFSVNSLGELVKKIIVISEPKGTFDSLVLKTFESWKFTPICPDLDEDLVFEAMQTFVFTLTEKQQIVTMKYDFTKNSLEETELISEGGELVIRKINICNKILRKSSNTQINYAPSAPDALKLTGY